MKSTIFFSCVMIAISPANAWAESCVSSTFDKPLPGATDVELRMADVPSALHPVIWQEGSLSGHFYKLFPDGTGSLASSQTRPDWKVEITCDLKDSKCAYNSSSNAPSSSYDVAKKIGQCLLGKKEISEEIEANPEALESEVTLKNEAIDSIKNKESKIDKCEDISVPEEKPEIALQLLLVLAGTDPGPIDGIIGSSTLKALDEVWNMSDPKLNLNDAILGVKKFLCKRQ